MRDLQISMCWGSKRQLARDSLIAIFGVLLIVYLWTSTLLFIYQPWISITWSNYAPLWIVFLSLSSVLLLMILWSFFAAAFTNPGPVPPNYTSTQASPVRHYHPAARHFKSHHLEIKKSHSTMV